MHELLDIVDFVFLVEATKSHKGVSGEQRKFQLSETLEFFNFNFFDKFIVAIMPSLNLFHSENCCGSYVKVHIFP